MPAAPISGRSRGDTLSQSLLFLSRKLLTQFIAPRQALRQRIEGTLRCHKNCGAIFPPAQLAMPPAALRGAPLEKQRVEKVLDGRTPDEIVPTWCRLGTPQTPWLGVASKEQVKDLQLRKRVFLDISRAKLTHSKRLQVFDISRFYAIM